MAPQPRLAPFVARLWHFESDQDVPRDDLKTVVPNGLMKLIFPYRGALLSQRDGAVLRQCPQSSIALVGLQDRPVTIDGQGPLAALGVELHMGLAHRFFRLRLGEVAHQVQLLDEVFGRQTADLSDQLASAPTLAERVAIVEALLLRLLDDGPAAQPVVTWTVEQLQRRQGAVRIADLCRELGYSRRTLDLRFAEHVGVSPKTLASIVRFQAGFRRLGAPGPSRALPPEALDLYHDQSHFIREFRRFAGRAPTAYLRGRNEFGELFYRR